MAKAKQPDSLAGLWIDSDGAAHLSWANGSNGPRPTESKPFRPFVWAMEGHESDAPSEARVEELSGSGAYNRLIWFDKRSEYNDFVKTHGREGSIDWIRQLEHQYLLERRIRLFDGMHFGQLRRMQLDIETASSEPGSFSDASRPEDWILAIGLSCGDKVELLELEEKTAAAEKRLLERFNERLQSIDPDAIEGHNIFKFDLQYLATRCKRYRIQLAWGRFGQRATMRSSRLKVAERWIDYPRFDLPGRAVVDTYLLIQIYDITARELMSYGLKDVAKHLGVTPEDGGDRVYIKGDKIQEMYDQDRKTFLAYLSDDLRETRGVADVLLPTYFEQAKAFPITLQEACLRGSAGKVDLVFQEEYYHRRASCPVPGETSAFAGGYTASFEEGVFKNVLHCDVASLYPSLLLLINRNPKPDTESVFIPMLQRLREYRLKYKKLARETEDPDLASEYNARQTSFKILINSFYGYLGFSGARFGDAELAAEVTARGRDLLQTLIDFFKSKQCRPLEADTDGIYVCSPEHFDNPEPLLAEAQAILPPGIELEYDGRYQSMFCYKAKNYALYDGERAVIRGSALRSRGIEPFLRSLTIKLINALLGASNEDPVEEAFRIQRLIEDGAIDIHLLAKSEVLSQNPDAYRRKIEAGGKPRRASAEVALALGGEIRMGDRVAYYIGPKSKGVTADWQRAQPVERYDPTTSPYDPSYYLAKLKDWRERYAPFCEKLRDNPAQGLLFG